MSIACFIDPVDVLYIRGNRLFGGAGEHGEALMPPWPSLASGAIRSHVLAACKADFESLACGETALFSNEVHAALGTPEKPGSFRLRWFSPAIVKDGRVQPFLPLPQDVFVADKDDEKPHMLCPSPLPEGVASSAPLARLPLLKSDGQAKPKSGLWLTAEGITHWVAGKNITATDLADNEALYKFDQRLGIARELTTGTAAEGRIYTSETVAFEENAGFLVLVKGADAQIIDEGLLRFGGDGRAARLNKEVSWTPPEPDWGRIEQEKACRILLSTPGLFPEGWMLPGMQADGTWKGPNGLTGRVIAAAVARAQVVSGWDLAALCRQGRQSPGSGHPKPAQRTAPVGSVYWLKGLEGDIKGGLEVLLQEGLWPCLPEEEWDRRMANWRQRRAEGFNNVLIGTPLQAAQKDN